jgi:2-methylcitrate dehydratase
VTPSQFTEKKLKDPVIWGLLPTIKVVANPELEELFPKLKATEVTISDNSGRDFSLRIDYPKGDYRDPMSEEELLEKFDSMVIEKVGQEARDRMVDLIMNLEQTKKIKDFMQYMTK